MRSRSWRAGEQKGLGTSKNKHRKINPKIVPLLPNSRTGMAGLWTRARRKAQGSLPCALRDRSRSLRVVGDPEVGVFNVGFRAFLALVVRIKV